MASLSESVPLRYGVPQWSVLGPILFTIYTLPLGDLMRSHGVPFQLFVGDCHLADSFKCGSPVLGQETVVRTEKCIGEVREWLLANKLSFNAPKTDFINVVLARKLSSIPEITVDGVKVVSSDGVRDLGVLIDKKMTMQQQVKRLCQAANFCLYKIGRIRKYLDQASVERLVQAFVISRLDGNNGVLYYGLPEKTITLLQRVQNSAANLSSIFRLLWLL